MEIQRTLWPVLGLLASVCFSPAFAHVDEESLTRVSGLELQGSEHVLHYGGYARESKALESRLPNGKVDIRNPINLNAPPSNSPIATSEKNTLQYDLVFVDEAFTQLYKQQPTINELKSQLKPTGLVLMHLPQYHEGAVGRALTTTLIDLKDELASSSKYHGYPKAEYQRLLKQAGLQVQSSQVVTHKRNFESQQAFKEFLKNNWSYLNGLKAQDQALFLDSFVNNYAHESKQTASGPIVWEQQILEIKANRA